MDFSSRSGQHDVLSDVGRAWLGCAESALQRDRLTDNDETWLKKYLHCLHVLH